MTGKELKQTVFKVECPVCLEVRTLPYKHAKKCYDPRCQSCKNKGHNK